MTSRIPRRWYEGGEVPMAHELEPPEEHEHWFSWGPPQRRHWTESAFVALALGVALAVLLVWLFGLAPLMALLG